MDSRKSKKTKYEPKPSQFKEVSQHQPEVVDLTDSSEESMDSDTKVIPHDHITWHPGGYIEDKLFNILALFRVRFNTFKARYGDDVGFNHVNESHDIYQEAMDSIIGLFETNFLCSE